MQPYYYQLIFGLKFSLFKKKKWFQTFEKQDNTLQNN